MAKQNGKKRSVGTTIALSIAALLFAAVVAYGGLMAFSIHRVNSVFDEAKTAYAQMKVDLESKEYDAALTDARQTATLMSDASAQMEGWHWDVAAVLPVLGTDVRAARSLGSISNDLSQEAVIPVLDAWDELTTKGAITNGQIDIFKVPTMIGQIKDLINALSKASAMVDDCKARVAEVPESHFDTINESTATLTEAIDSADEAFVQFDKISQAIGDLSEAVNGVVDN